MENRCKEEDSSTLEFLGEIKEGMEQKHSNKTEAEIAVMFRGYMVDLLGNYLIKLDDLRAAFPSVESKKIHGRERLLDDAYMNPSDFTFRILGLRDIYDQVKFLTLVSPASYPAMSPQLAAWEPTINKANAERMSMDGFFSFGVVADYDFLWNFLQNDIPRMREELKLFSEFWKKDAAEAVEVVEAAEGGDADGAEKDKNMVEGQGNN